jgi:putative ABC transport system permease protein
MSEEEYDEMLRGILAEQTAAAYAETIKKQFEAVPDDQLAAMLDAAILGYTDEQIGRYYDEVMTFAPTSYKTNLRLLGCVELNDPSTISLYASTFADKDVIEAAIEKYNDGVDEAHKISYTDYVGLMMSSVTTIIDAITYVLIGFVSVSLIVSSIMIGVITLISVQERTKEIGILRAIGASKKNVSRMFNAETVIIGFISGLVGVGVTYLLCIPLNAILLFLTDISNLRAQLPIGVAAILVLISVALTLISGIIPSRSASKKDPVVALRTE